MRFKRLSFTAALLAVLIIPFAVTTAQTHAVSGSDWRAGTIISDSLFTDANAMSVQQIQSYLNSLNPSCDTWGTQPASSSGRADLSHAQYAASKGWAAPPYVCLKDYYEVPKTNPGAGVPDNSFSHYDGANKQLLPVPGGVSAAQLIYNAAQTYGISPKALIVTIQKESGGPLTTDTWPLQSQYTFAMGAHCPDTAGCDTNYAGFSIQIAESAALFRYYLNNMTQPWWPYKKIGTNNVLYNPSSSCGSSSVNITTSATAALYTYTPYQPDQAALNNLYGSGGSCSAYGNRNFWRFFNDMFGSSVVPPSSVYIPEGTYTLSNTGSGRVLDVANGSSNNGASTQIYSGNNTPAQMWHITRNADGYYQLTNVSSGKSLDVEGGNSMAGSRVQIWPSNTGCSQQWAAIVAPAGSVTFLSTCSGLALDVKNGSTANGTGTQTYNRNGSPAQNWRLQALDTPPVADGFYKFNAPSGLSLSAAATTNGATAQINSSTTSGSSYWKVTRHSNGLYGIFNPASSNYLDVRSEGRTAGTAIQLWQGHQTCAQEWQIVKNSNNSYTLISGCSGLALDVVNGATATPNTATQLYTNNGTPAQQWTFEALPQIPDATYSIQSVGGQVLDVINGSSTPGTRVQLWYPNATNAQRWRVSYQGNDLYAFQNVNSGMYLDLAGASTSPGTTAQIYSGNGSCAQRWKLIDNGNSTFRVAPSCTLNNALDIAGANVTTPGTRVQSYPQNGSAAQMWIFDAP